MRWSVFLGLFYGSFGSYLLLIPSISLSNLSSRDAPESYVIVITVIRNKIELVRVCICAERMHTLGVSLEAKIIVLIESSISQPWLVTTSIYYFKILLQASTKII